MTQQRRDKLQNDNPETPGPLHKLLGKSPAQVDEELLALGYDPAEQVDAMRRLGRALRSKSAAHVQAQKAKAASSPANAYPLYKEAVAAGMPDWDGDASDHADATLFKLLGGGDPSDYFWARVSGWSMRDAGISDGDLTLISRKAEPKDGDIVLAHLAGRGQLIKRLKLGAGQTASLESANPDFAAIELNDLSVLRFTEWLSAEPA